MKFAKNEAVDPTWAAFPLADLSPLPAEPGAPERTLGAPIHQIAPGGDFYQAQPAKSMITHQPDRAGRKAFAPFFFFSDQKADFGRSVSPVDWSQLDVPDMVPAPTREDSQQKGLRVMVGLADHSPELANGPGWIKTNFQKFIDGRIPQPAKVSVAGIPGGKAT